jgi:hypothetical protein
MPEAKGAGHAAAIDLNGLGMNTNTLPVEGKVFDRAQGHQRITSRWRRIPSSLCTNNR